MQRITSFFWFCSGADVNLLKKAPTETSKYVGMGATIFFTGLFAALAAGYALYSVFDSIMAACFFGLLWGLMIFNLDRYIVCSMRKEGRTMREIGFATPRIVLAILISIVIAKPLELKIFNKEIEPELVVMQQEKFAAQEEKVRARFEATQDSLKTQIARLKHELQQQALKRDELVRIAREEADGTGGSRKKNLGPIYKIKKADADQAESELRALEGKNLPLIAQLQQSLTHSMDQVTREIANLERRNMNGPAAQIEALDRVMARSNAITWAHWFIFLLFIAIETSPIFVKLISGKGPYDHLLKMEEHQYFAQESEVLARTNAQIKDRNVGLPAHEKGFLNNRLDTGLKQS